MNPFDEAHLMDDELPSEDTRQPLDSAIMQRQLLDDTTRAVTSDVTPAQFRTELLIDRAFEHVNGSNVQCDTATEYIDFVNQVYQILDKRTFTPLDGE